MTTIKLTVHHIAGQERFPIIPRHYFAGEAPTVRRILPARPQDRQEGPSH